MTDVALEKTGVSGSNGGPEHNGVEPKTTVLGRDDALSGRLQLKGGGQLLGNFSGQVECDGDLLIGPEAHVEADIHTAKITIAGFVRGKVVALVVQEGGVHKGVIRVHPEGVPEGEEQVIADAGARQPVAIKSVPIPVGRVRKFWGEFF